MNRVIMLLVMLFSFSSFSAFADEWIWYHYTGWPDSEGPLSDMVTGIAEDTSGIMWFTCGGVSAFNGIDWTHYYDYPNSKEFKSILVSSNKCNLS